MASTKRVGATLSTASTKTTSAAEQRVHKPQRHRQKHCLGTFELPNLRDVRRPTFNVQRPTSNLQRPASNVQRPTSDLQPPTSNLQPPTSDVRRPTSTVRRPTAFDLQPPTCNLPTSGVRPPTLDVDVDFSCCRVLFCTEHAESFESPSPPHRRQTAELTARRGDAATVTYLLTHLLTPFVRFCPSFLLSSFLLNKMKMNEGKEGSITTNPESTMKSSQVKSSPPRCVLFGCSVVRLLRSFVRCCSVVLPHTNNDN